MLEKLGNICVIGLKAREDRWARCEEIFKELNVSRVTRFTTVQDFQDPHRNYMKDFLQLLRLRGYENMMFFEDDFEFIPGWEEVLEKAVSELPEDFDMLYMGANLTRAPLYESEHLMRVRGAWLMHATLLSKKWIQFILKNYDRNQIWIIDEWYRQIAPERKFYMTYPQICYQRPDYSDMLGQYVDYKTIAFNNKFYLEYENTFFGSRLPAGAECRS